MLEPYSTAYHAYGRTLKDITRQMNMTLQQFTKEHGYHEPRITAVSHTRDDTIGFTSIYVIEWLG